MKCIPYSLLVASNAASLILTVVVVLSWYHSDGHQNNRSLLLRSKSSKNCCACNNNNNNNNDPLDVIIVGAGWAGLAAADYLQKNSPNTNFLLLEARDYVGGRSRTVYDFDQDEALPVELGSEWIYPNTPLQDIVDREGIAHGVTRYRYSTFDVYYDNDSGEVLPGDDVSSLFRNVWSNGFVPYSSSQAAASQASGTDTDFEDVVESYNADLPESDRQFVNSMVNTEVVTEFAGPVSDLSTASVGDRLGEGGALSYMAVPGGGYGKTVQAIARSFQDRIRLSSRVVGVEYGTNRELCTVSYKDNSVQPLQQRARTVLVTVPLGVLKSRAIYFSPSLSLQKEAAIDNIGMGNLNKCIMYWNNNQSWWPTKVWLDFVTDRDETSGEWTLFFNAKSQGNGNHNVLVGWIGGDNADAMESQSDEVVLSQVLTNLRTMLGERVPRPNAFHITRWREDEFAKGAYSYPTVGTEQFRAAQRDLGRTEQGNLFFAGEATDVDLYGTTTGAFNSGVRAATSIISYLADVN